MNWIRICAIVFVTSVFLGGCERKSPAASPGTADAKPAVRVFVAPVERVAIDDFVEIVGSLEADEQVSVAAEVSGRIVSLEADLGDRVPPSAALARIDPTDYIAAVRQRQAELSETLARLGTTSMPGDDFSIEGVPSVARARVQLENARSRFNRIEQLFRRDPPLVSEQDFTDAKAAVEVAERDVSAAELEAQALVAAAFSRSAQLASAQENLEKTTVKAPAFAGDPERFAVAARHVSVGSFVRVGDVLFELVADNPLRFRGAVPEVYSERVRVGQTVTLQLAGRDDFVSGAVTRIEPRIDRASRTFLIEATIANGDHAIRAGTFARARVTVGQIENTPAVPVEAVREFVGSQRVFFVRDGKAVQQAVKTIRRADGRAYLEALPADAALVVLNPPSNLTDGDAVEVVEK